MKSLFELCETSLMRNHKYLQDVRDIPYRLLKNVLKQVKLEALQALECTNPLLIFYDDDLWLQFLRQDFPTSVHESYISKKNAIVDYYINFINECSSEIYKLNCRTINNTLADKIKKDPNHHHKFHIPYRMLYLRYQKDILKKQEQSAERLRLQTRKIQEEQARKQTVTVDPSFYQKFQRKYSAKKKNNNSERSELFRQSYKEHQKRLQLFRDGGFDICQRHALRTDTMSSDSRSHDKKIEPTKPLRRRQNSPTTKPEEMIISPKKRRTAPTSIFLNKRSPPFSVLSRIDKSPTLKAGNSSAQPTSKENGVFKDENSHQGHKKPSNIFNNNLLITKQMNSMMERNEDRSRNQVYVHDKRYNRKDS